MLSCVQGHFPRSWRIAAGKMKRLYVQNNPGLDGCVPLSTGEPELLTMRTSNTQISGMCSFAGTAASKALQQWRALRSLLPRVLVGTGAHAKGFNQMVQDLLKGLSKLGRLVGDGETSTTLTSTSAEHFLAATVTAINDEEYVTDLSFYHFHYKEVVPLHPAIHLAALVKLMTALPRIESFECNVCDGNPTPDNLQLLSGLAATSLQKLVLPECGLIGRLPLQWSAWQGVHTINLNDNELTGVLPSSWAALSNLSEVYLSNNNLQGSLPDSWGQGTIMPKNLQLGVRNNAQLTGSIPSSWAHFALGQFTLYGTGIGGCVPDGLEKCVWHDHPLKPCYNERAEATSFVQLKLLLQAPGISVGPGLSNWTAGEQTALRGRLEPCNNLHSDLGAEPNIHPLGRY